MSMPLLSERLRLSLQGMSTSPFQVERNTITAGKISIWHISIFISKGISKWAIDTKFPPDVAIKPNIEFIQRNQNI